MTKEEKQWVSELQKLLYECRQIVEEVIAAKDAEIAAWAEKVAEQLSSIKGLRNRIASIEANNKRLRETLETIAEDTSETQFGGWPTKGSKIARQALDRFDEAAQCWGWEKDQGSNEAVIRQSKAEYDASYKELEKLLTMIEPPSAREQAFEEAAQAAEGRSPSFDHQAALAECRDCESGFHNGRVAAAAAIRARKSQPAPQHPDDIAVDSFASQMKAKLAQKRAEGRTDLQKRYTHNLSILLHEHVAKGDPIDVAIICMMLAMNGQRIGAPQTGGGHEKI